MERFLSYGLLAALAGILLFSGCTQQGNNGYYQPPSGSPPSPGSQPGQVGTGQQTAQASPASGEGRAVITITDAAADMGSVSGINITVGSISVHSAQGGWATVSSTQKTYDLLQLRASGAQSLLADANLSPGTYDQIRLEISNVAVTDSNGTHNAKLPSGDLTIKGGFSVAANSTTSLNLDFAADRSLHLTGNGRYILAPVVRLQEKDSADVDASNEADVKVRGGRLETDIEVGMNENGAVGEGIVIRPDANLTIGDDGKIRAMMPDGGKGPGKGNGYGDGGGSARPYNESINIGDDAAARLRIGIQ
ncbi:Uncharacterised protein [Candidatus Burarchaeum australiense]|nr:Uncharacterised protein [Candidatus Burarchaeum australiense]